MNNNVCQACGVKTAADAVQCNACKHVVKLRSSTRANGDADWAELELLSTLAQANIKKLEQSLRPDEIKAAEGLAREFMRTGNFLSALLQLTENKGAPEVTQKPNIPAARAKEAVTPDRASASQPLVYKAGNILRDHSLTPEMVVIPAGEFIMGGNGFDREQPIHRVKIPQFAIGKAPVTQAQWKALMGNNPSHFQGDGNDNCPVEQVSWDDTQQYIAKLNALTGQKYRLPSEAEWEYACRAGSTGEWCFGDDESQLTHYAWYQDNSDGKTHPVGQKRPNAFGLYDVHGNVWEWVQDCWNENYHGAPTDGSAWLTGDCRQRVVRGGSWFNDVGGFSPSVIDGNTALPLTLYQIIRRNGGVVPFEPNKIAVAMMKAFLAVLGTQGAASASVRESVEVLTQQVVQALMRSRPGGGTFYIEHVQDQVELGLMRGGHQNIAVSYVLYRERRTQERAKQVSQAVPAVPALHVLDNGQRVALDLDHLKARIKAACANLGADIDPEVIMLEILPFIYDVIPTVYLRSDFRFRVDSTYRNSRFGVRLARMLP